MTAAHLRWGGPPFVLLMLSCGVLGSEEPSASTSAVPDADGRARPEREIEPYELVERRDEGCEQDVVPYGLRMRPSTPDAIQCTEHSECAAAAHGRCEAATFQRCRYPGSEQTCQNDADCALLKWGRCAEPERRCASRETCLELESRFCTYSALTDGCLSDADCDAAPNGKCERMIAGSYCRAEECRLDSDCSPDSRCFCDHTQRECRRANCTVDRDCPDGQRCAQTAWLHTRPAARSDPRSGHLCNGEGRYAFCTTAADECTSGLTCGDGFACGYDQLTRSYACLGCEWQLP